MNTGTYMNNPASNVGGWRDTHMRSQLKTVYSELPRKWKAMIRTVTVRSSEGGTSAEIISSEDELFLLSAAEVGFSAAQTPYLQEIDPDAEDVTFPVFTNNDSRLKRRYNGGGEVVGWWLRSPKSDSSQNFYIPRDDGAENWGSSHYTNGISWACCMGGACE
jgi:hypothetical protein